MKKNYFLIMMMFTTLILSGCSEKSAPVLNGDESITIEVFGEWADLGVNYDKTCEISGIVNTDVVDTYTITYTCGKDVLTRNVTVVDTEIPIITLTEGDITLEFRDAYIEPGYEAMDNYDGDISTAVTISGDVDITVPGEYYITYSVEDQNNNAAISVTRKVTVEEPTTNNPPYIVIVASGEIYVPIDSDFVFPDAYCYDYEDGDLSENIVTSGSVDTSIDGPYEILYTCTDSDGNITNSAIIVNVVLEATDNEPVIFIKEFFNAYVVVNSVWTPPLLVAYDFEDGDITSSIVEEGIVDTTQIGKYTIKYSVMDSAGMRVEYHLQVNVFDPNISTLPKFIITGPAIDTIPLGRNYRIPNVYAFSYLGMDISDSIIITGFIDTSIIGFQKITFTVSDSENNTISVDHYVAVTNSNAENQEPYIFVNGPYEITIVQNDSYIDLGATCFDPEDGDLTASIVVSNNVDTSIVGDYEVWYGCIDTGGKFIGESRTVHVVKAEDEIDNVPYINLFVGTQINIEVGSTWVDPGYIAYDYEDGIVTDLVTISGDVVDTTTPGYYEISYQILDEMSNVIVEVIRTVHVEETN